jgi:hypothetical protein
MRIVATAILIATAATAAGCGGSSSSSSSQAPAKTVAQTTPAPSGQVAPAPTRSTPAHRHSTTAHTMPTAARTHPAPARPKPAATPTPPASRTARGVKALPAHLVGRSLEVATTMLRNAGISYKVIPLHGHGTAAASSWGVCETTPVATPSLTGATSVGLVVAHLKCGAH